MRRPLFLAIAFVCALSACFATEKDALHERSSKVKQAMPACDAGDANACSEACDAGGSNKACTRGCDSDHGASCAQLANRLENGLDVDDPEAGARHVDQGDPESITGLYEKACRLGFGGACQIAGGRILNGVGRGSRNGGTAVELLKLGCQKWKSADACCSMSQLNLKLAEGSNVNTITDFRGEAEKWSKLGERYGKSCPQTIEPTPATVSP